MDSLLIGEVLVDFTPGKEENSYIANPGGAPANVAVSMRRNGMHVGFLGKVGEDFFGHKLIDKLIQENIEILGGKFTNIAATTMAFVSIDRNGERSFSFARKPGADLMLNISDINLEDIKIARLVHAGSMSLSGNPSRETVYHALKIAKENCKLVSFDINYRDAVWSKEEAEKYITPVMQYVDLLKISDEETYFVGGEDNIPYFLKRYNITVLVETMGDKGAKYYFKDSLDGIHSGFIRGLKVKAVDSTGAGDAFWGAFLSSLLNDGINKTSDIVEDKLVKAVCYGNSSGALCVKKKGGIPAIPTKEQIDKFLETNYVNSEMTGDINE